MITHAKKLFIKTSLFITFLTLPLAYAVGFHNIEQRVTRIIDGDTFEISGGQRVRLLGIDAPEKGEEISVRAADRLRELTASGKVILEMCEKPDTYGRLLATVRSNGINVNEALLKEGMALPMLIPPCGRSVATEILQAAAQGALSGKGIYSLVKFRIISHVEAGSHIGESIMVRGRIRNLHRGSKAWHLNFGSDWKTDFTAVLFDQGLNMFNDLGMDLADLVGVEVLVIGKVKLFNGPEIIVHSPDQLIPLKSGTISDSGSGIQGGSQVE